MNSELKTASIRTGDSQLLYLTNNRSFQQPDFLKRLIKESKDKLKGRKFFTRSVPPKFCKTKKYAVLVYEAGNIRKICIRKIGCNSWTCPDCQITKALKLKYWLLEICRLNNIGYHLVLTLDPKSIPQEYSKNTHRYITKIFNHFVTVLKRKKFNYWNKKKNKYNSFSLKNQKNILKYIWVLQYQPKNGRAHLHILLNQFLPIEVIRKLWTHVGGGIEMNIEKVISVEGISHYVTDYVVSGISKDEQEGGFNFFERRYSVSKSCKKPQKKGKRVFQELSSSELKQKLNEHKLGFIYEELENDATPEKIYELKVV